MHHFRGRLRSGDEDEMVLDPANAYVEYLGPQDGTKPNWNGYLVVPDESAVETGGEYRLELEDGRSGDLIIDHIEADESGRYKAVFSGESPLA